MNSNPSILSAEDGKELDRLVDQLPDTTGGLPGCADYQKYKSYVSLALPIISKIPVYGPKIVSVIQFLMTVADSVCGATAASARKPA